MEVTTLELTALVEATETSAQQVRELNELQLALVGGGIGETAL